MPAITILPPADLLSCEADDALVTLVRLVARHKVRPDSGLGTVIPALVAEGRRFSRTESGVRWRSLLAGSSLVANGWLLWNALDLDRHTSSRDMDPEGDSPSEMLDALLREVAQSRAETLVAALDAIAAEMAVLSG